MLTRMDIFLNVRDIVEKHPNVRNKTLTLAFIKGYCQIEGVLAGEIDVLKSKLTFMNKIHDAELNVLEKLHEHKKMLYEKMHIEKKKLFKESLRKSRHVLPLTAALTKPMF